MREPSIVIVAAYSALGLLLDEVLTGEGYKVRLWPNTADAFEFIQQEQPDLVILDLPHKRHVDSLVVLEQLSHHPATRTIPMLALAGIQAQVRKVECFRDLGLCPTQQCPEPCNELIELEGLDQVIISAAVEAGNAIGQGIAGGEHHHRGPDPTLS